MMKALAIRIPDDSSTVARIRRGRYLPLHGRPLKLKLPGALVVLVQVGGRAALIAQATDLQGPEPVTLVDGKRRAGYKLLLSGLKRPASDERLRIKWHAIGQFRYFDPRSWVPTIVGPLESEHGDYIEEVDSRGPGLTIRRRPFMGSVQGRPRSHPESVLVRRFVAWLNCEPAIEQHQLLPDGFVTDLFDASKWRLIEAKVACDRETLRQALGQLYDYRLFYRRRPSLGVLLGSRPTKRCVEFLQSHRVSVIWETAGGAFNDSADGEWSRLRRSR
jgi:hypothetical protein